MSPVHDQSYRRYPGTKLPFGRAWLVILRAGLRSFFSRRVLLGLLLLAWVPFLMQRLDDQFMMRQSEAPSERTARMWTSSRTARTLPRTTRAWIGVNTIAIDSIRVNSATDANTGQRLPCGT